MPLGGAAGAYNMSDLYKAGAIPEPAGWAMMLSGFGLVGRAVRRRVQELPVCPFEALHEEIIPGHRTPSRQTRQEMQAFSAGS